MESKTAPLYRSSYSHDEDGGFLISLTPPEARPASGHYWARYTYADCAPIPVYYDNQFDEIAVPGCDQAGHSFELIARLDFAPPAPDLIHVQASDARGIVRRRWIVQCDNLDTDSMESAIQAVRDLDPEEPLPENWLLSAGPLEYFRTGGRIVATV